MNNYHFNLSKTSILFLLLKTLIPKSFPLIFSWTFPFHPVKFSHLYLFLLSSQALQPVGKLPVSKDLLNSVRTQRSPWPVHAQPSFLWQCYTESYCPTKHQIDQKCWGRAIRTSTNYLWVVLPFFPQWNNIPSFLLWLLYFSNWHSKMWK